MMPNTTPRAAMPNRATHVTARRPSAPSSLEHQPLVELRRVRAVELPQAVEADARADQTRATMRPNG